MRCKVSYFLLPSDQVESDRTGNVMGGSLIPSTSQQQPAGQMAVYGGHVPNRLLVGCTTKLYQRSLPPYDAQALLSAAEQRSTTYQPHCTVHNVHWLKFERMVYCLLSFESSSISWRDSCTHTQAIWTHLKPKEPGDKFVKIARLVWVASIGWSRLHSLAPNWFVHFYKTRIFAALATGRWTSRPQDTWHCTIFCGLDYMQKFLDSSLTNARTQVFLQPFI